jgi:imidazole glycerol-phosphate synthase subunit HisH
MISILKYNAGNIQSVLFALARIGVAATVTDDIETIQKSEKVIFPGVGEASTAMQYLKERNLDKLIQDLKQPVLGICLGMQLLCSHSEENDTDCLNIFSDVNLKHFTPSASSKVPQIGWNKVSFSENKLFKNITSEQYVYNVHGYYVPINPYTIATCNYTLNYSAAIQNKNFYGVQFHPEKSSTIGETILKNFINL